jgi:hypothetical protein
MEPSRTNAPPEEPASAEGTAVRVGRGAALIAMAKVVFLLTGRW